MTTEIAVKEAGFNFSASSLEQAKEFSKIISNSDLAPKDYKGKPDNILVAIAMGSEVGLKPLQALQNIAVINGRPSVWGDAALAIVKSHKDFENVDESFSENTATCAVYRKGQSPVIRTFSIDDAKKAGLWGKAGPWTQYPQRMLQMRARGFALRDAFPDALKGMITAEEASDIPVERNMGSAQLVESSSEKAQRLKERLGIKPPVNESVDLSTGEIFDNSSVASELTQQINNASSLDDLEIVRTKIAASPLTDNEKNPLRQAYAAKSKELKFKDTAETSQELSAESKEFFGEDK